VDKIGEAIIKLLETGAPLASNTISWWFTIKMIDMVLGNVEALAMIGFLFYVAGTALKRWKDFADTRRKFWETQRH
jgi:hypothetical protein